MTLQPAQFDLVLSLNNEFAKETSFLNPEGLNSLSDCAYFAKTIGELDAFIVAMSHNSAYDGVNFNWFKERYDSFAYIDRVVTATHARGRGFAKSLYYDLIEQAKNDKIDMISCEINHAPPNPGSVAFHKKLGFELIDKAQLAENKTVGYWVLNLSR